MRCFVTMIGFIVALNIVMGLSGCSNPDSDSATSDDPTELAIQDSQREKPDGKITSTGSPITAKELLSLVPGISAHVIEIDQVDFDFWLEFTTARGEKIAPYGSQKNEIRWNEPWNKDIELEKCRIIVYWRADKSRGGLIGVRVVHGGTYSFGVPPDDLWFGWKSWNSIGSIPKAKTLQVGKPNTVFEYQFTQPEETGESDEESAINMKLIVVPLASAQADK